MLLYRRADCNKCNASIPNWYLRDGYYLRLGKGNWSVLLADDDKRQVRAESGSMHFRSDTKTRVPANYQRSGA